MLPLILLGAAYLIEKSLQPDTENYHLGGDMSKHLAPNGKPSKLTHEQWHLVRTPAFKAWFGDWENDAENASKVVDTNGEPLVLYHGTNNEFTVFNQNDRIDFINYKKLASDYGKNILECFLVIKNPFIFTNKKHELGKDNYDGEINKDFLKHRPQIDYVKDATRYSVFKSTQIKLSDGTNTTFDGSNPDIRYKEGGRTIAQTPAPKKDRIYGSKVNPKGSASSEKSASKIKLSKSITESLSNKLSEFKKDSKKDNVSLNDLKAVYRRGLGAYSSSHRPTISGGKPNTRNAWAMARVNKFLLKASGEKVKKAYVQDDDLL